MKKLMVLLIALTTVSPAFAGKSDCTWDPPRQYDGAASLQFDLYVLPEAKLKKACDRVFNKYAMTPKSWYNGCADDGTNEVFILEGGRGCVTEEAILRHELGHLMGWRHD